MARPIKYKPRSDISRLRRQAMNTLGTIMTDDMSHAKVWRDDVLDLYDRYYESSQYDDLQDWEDAVSANTDDYVEIRKRKPRIIYNLPKVLVDKVSSKLIGSSTFPQFVIEDDEEDTIFLRTVQKASKFRRSMIDPIKHLLISGAVFVRYYMINGVTKIEYAKSKYCYPVFDATGELEQVEIKYVYEDQNDRSKSNTPKQKWYRIVLTKTADILFDNPEYRPGVTPDFKEVARQVHNLGWVQGEWFVTHTDKFDYDGCSLFGDIIGFIDELNYSLSQSSQAIGYNQEPQLVMQGLSEGDIDNLIKSSMKAWNLPRDAEAKYLETSLEGVKQATETRDRMRNMALDVVRVILQDPEKFKGQAQSGEAMKQLYAPLIELVDELRAAIEPNLTNLLIKIAMTMLKFVAMGEEAGIQVPDGYIPQSMDITTQWPPIFPPTIQDMHLMAQTCQTLSMANIISRESLTRWMAQVIPNIDNVEEELKKIESQPPPPSPFGDFGGPPQGE